MNWKTIKDYCSAILVFALCFGAYALAANNEQWFVRVWIVSGVANFMFDIYNIMKYDYKKVKGNDLFPIGSSVAEQRVIDILKSVLWSFMTLPIFAGVGCILCVFAVVGAIFCVVGGIAYFFLKLYWKAEDKRLGVGLDKYES